MAIQRRKSDAVLAATFLGPAMRPWLLVSQVYRMADKLLDRRLIDVGIGANQGRVLSVIRSAGSGIRPSEIAAILFLDDQTTLATLTRMERRGWITRGTNAGDRRAVPITLTAKGAKVAGKVEKVSQELYRETFAAALTASQLKTVAELLAAVRATAFALPESDFKLRRARSFRIWTE